MCVPVIPLVLGVAAAGAVMGHAPTAPGPDPAATAALEQQAKAAGAAAVPQQDSVVGNDAQTVLNRLRGRSGAVGLGATDVTGGQMAPATVANPSAGVSPSGYTSQKGKVGQ